jgi:hypothetical protein
MLGVTEREQLPVAAARAGNDSESFVFFVTFW